jgi:DNA-binding HxlR family transcriptional regulator
MKLQKETKKDRGAHGRWYDDACGTAFALELVGERWALLIVRELMLGGRRFSDLRGSLPAISAKVLTERLESLAEAGIVRRRQLPPPAATQVYELTDWGYRAETVVQELGRWAAMSPDHDPTLPLSAVSLIISFRTMFDPSRAAGLSAQGALQIAGEPFQVTIERGRLTAERGEPAAPDFTLAADNAMPIAALVYGKTPPDALTDLAWTGDRLLLGRFVDCFHLPSKAR